MRPLKNIGMALLIEYLKVGCFLDNLDIKKTSNIESLVNIKEVERSLK